MDEYTDDYLFDCLEEDFAMLGDGSWVPDADSISASVEVLAELRRRLRASSKLTFWQRWSR